MAKDNSQSPRATRSSTNDPEAFALGEVKVEEYSGDDVNSDAWSHADSNAGEEGVGS